MRIGSLFSGYGGLDRAVAQHYGATVAWHVEFDKHPSAILAHHYPHIPNHGDVTAVDWSQVEPVDIVTGGYPCQPFSHAGQRRGTNDDRHLWPYVADAIRVLRPRLAVFENVAGHLTLGFDTVLADLAGLGFDAEWGVVSAAEAGAPHRRQRLFIVATDATRERIDRGRGAGTRRWDEPTDGGSDPDLTLLPTPTSRDWKGRNQRDDTTCLPGAVAVDFGPYTAAIRRWEQVLGRPAPPPTEPGQNGRPRLSPRFVEWMQGLPDGLVTGVDIPRSAQLKALGNGVVPAQALLALQLLDGNR
jgi:DNA (cytosine-5)-methyltransferase 1